METTTRRTRTRGGTHVALAVVTLATWLSAAHRAGAVVAEVDVAAGVDQVSTGSAVPVLLPVALLVVVVVARLVASTAARRGHD